METESIGKEQKEVQEFHRVVREIIQSIEENKWTNILLSNGYPKIFINEYDTHILVLHGGMNGFGQWSDYFTTLAVFVQKAKAKGYDVRLVDMKVDWIDDVFSAYFMYKKTDSNWNKDQN